jgi:Cys-rich protein (TIGR01571 family)
MGPGSQPYYTPLPTAPPQTPSNEIQVEPHAQWSSGICDCCSGEGSNCGTCCLAGICGGVALAFLMEKLELVPSSICPMVIFTVQEIISGRSLVQMSAFAFRRSLVLKADIKENPCDTFCNVCCCFPCAIAQMERDAEKYGYVFSKPITGKGQMTDLAEGCTACVGGASNDRTLIQKKKQAVTPMAAPFTQNGMSRLYYIRK